MSEYTKEFEKWYERHHYDMGGLEQWKVARYKKALSNAFKAGKKKGKSWRGAVHGGYWI